MKLSIFYFDPKITRMFVEKTNEAGEKVIVLSSPYNFVYRDEIVARVINVDNEEDAALQVDKGYAYYQKEKYIPFKPGEGIAYDDSASCYRATQYGFVIFDRNTSRLRLITPLQISKEKLKAYYVVFPTKFFKIPEYREIEEIVQKNRIVALLDKAAMEADLAKIDPGKLQLHRVVVARGKEPVNGYAEYYIPLIRFEKKAGRVMEDGRMDFKELDSIIEIKKGQEVLKRVPDVKPQDGYNIYGEKMEAVIEERNGVIKGENIVQSVGDEYIYVATTDGCLDVDKKKISVSAIATTRDVNYDSGNIDFNGSVQIRGSVFPGFSVKAKGNIIVDKNVDDAYLEAGGDVIVKFGIGGKGSSKIVSGGRIKTKFILNSTVEAVGEIEVEDSIINSKVFSNDKVSVTTRHGEIIGGETTARHEIIVNVAGSTTENLTILSAGRSLFVEREILEIRREMNNWRTQVDEVLRKIKTGYGEGLFENPKEFISILPPVKKKNCLLLLSELSRCNRELKGLAALGIEAEKKLMLEREPVIVVTDQIYAGSIVNIKKRRRRIDENLQNVKFFEDPDEKIIRYTAAV